MKEQSNVSQASEIITLSNGKKVANFSSPHPFNYTDGSILPAVSNEESERLKIIFTEDLINDDGDIELDFKLSVAVLTEMDIWMDKWEDGLVDVVVCPLPMIVAIKDTFGLTYLLNSPFRAIRIDDRIKKLASIEKQCV